MVETGKSIILITHRLNEARTASDSITVLRKGRVVAAEVKPREASRLDLVNMIVGRPLEFRPRAGNFKKGGKLVLECENLRVLDDRGLVAVKDVSFVLKEGSPGLTYTW